MNLPMLQSSITRLGITTCASVLLLYAGAYALEQCNGKTKKTQACASATNPLECPDIDNGDGTYAIGKCFGKNSERVRDTDYCGDGSATTHCVVRLNEEGEPVKQVCTELYKCELFYWPDPPHEVTCTRSDEPVLDDDTGDPIISEIDDVKNESCQPPA